MRHYWVEQTRKILEDAGLERPEGRGFRWKGQRAISAKVHTCKVYLKDRGWLDSYSVCSGCHSERPETGWLVELILKAGEAQD